MMMHGAHLPPPARLRLVVPGIVAERPIYFIETREGHTCSWCSLKGDQLILQPHPLSPVPPKMLKYTTEAEVIGQVVGLAMRLGEWRALSGKDSPAPKELN